VTLAGRDGQVVHLTDVTRLVEDHQPLIGDAIINGGPGLMLMIEKFPWANTLDVTRGVEEALAELRPGLTGIAIDSTIFRPADFIELALGNLTTALLVGSILVFLVLLAWLTVLILRFLPEDEPSFTVSYPVSPCAPHGHSYAAQPVTWRCVHCGDERVAEEVYDQNAA